MLLKISRFTLKNGLRVVINEDPYSTMVAVCIAYLVGNRTEKRGKTGISHVLEHMMFKGTERISPEEYSKRIQRIGGYENAYTSKDYTAYYAYLPVEGLEIFLDLESDRMVNLKIRDFEEEMEVIKDERRYTSQDNPVDAFMEEFWMQLFKSHPYRYPIIGLLEDLEKMNLQDVFEYYNTYYVPSNAILSISGNVKEGEAFELVSKYFGSLEKNGDYTLERIEEPEQNSKRFFKVKRKNATPLVVLGFKTVPVSSVLTPVFEVMGEVLCGGKWGLLVKDLVYEKKIFASIACDSTFLLDTGVFSIIGVPSPGKNIFDAYRILENRLYGSTQEITEALVETAKSKILADFYFNIESVRDVVLDLAEFEMAGDAGLINHYPDLVRTVKLDSLRDVFLSYFSEDKETAGVLYG
ncbi:MAG: pitrilysin family protein [candidate division WOR-3 bacterium]